MIWALVDSSGWTVPDWTVLMEAVLKLDCARAGLFPTQLDWIRFHWGVLSWITLHFIGAGHGLDSIGLGCA